MKTVLLMGGKSSRMGSPKHLLQLNNKTFFEHLCENLVQIAPVIISTSVQMTIKDSTYPIIVDQYPSIGPINGLYSCLCALHEPILVVPCDHPFITASHLHQLLKHDEQRIDALVVSHQGKAYPTIGLYHPSCISYMKEMIDQKNYRMMQLLDTMKVKYIEASDIGLTERELMNINTPEDYQSIRKAV